MGDITSVEQLDALYGQPGEAALVKELDRLIPEYAAFIEASPFVSLATAGPEGLDCSPRGDLPGFVRVKDERTLLMPDRRGNNRADSLKNVVRDGRVALLFLVPGSGTTLRINGRATLSADAGLCASFAVDGHAPRTVMVGTRSRRLMSGSSKSGLSTLSFWLGNASRLRANSAPFSTNSFDFASMPCLAIRERTTPRTRSPFPKACRPPRKQACGNEQAEPGSRNRHIHRPATSPG
jgi:predicted pyridoxine 5'-phosphate oxidase superfamily flavin-nucleotide-binding protein